MTVKWDTEAAGSMLTPNSPYGEEERGRGLENGDRRVGRPRKSKGEVRNIPVIFTVNKAEKKLIDEGLKLYRRANPDDWPSSKSSILRSLLLSKINEMKGMEE